MRFWQRYVFCCNKFYFEGDKTHLKLYFDKQNLTLKVVSYEKPIPVYGL